LDLIFHVFLTPFSSFYNYTIKTQLGLPRLLKKILSFFIHNHFLCFLCFFLFYESSPLNLFLLCLFFSVIIIHL
jgi:hypothetical protein